MTLYNLRNRGDQYRITKFTNDLDVESSYLLTETECECPAGHRPTCRHRQMLPEMLAYDMANTRMFYDFETKVVLEQTFDNADEVEPEPLAEVEAEVVDIPTDANGNIDFDTIATTQPHSTTVSASDFDSEDGGSNPPEVAKSINTQAFLNNEIPMNDEIFNEQIYGIKPTPHPSIGPIKRRI